MYLLLFCLPACIFTKWILSSPSFRVESIWRAVGSYLLPCSIFHQDRPWNQFFHAGHSQPLSKQIVVTATHLLIDFCHSYTFSFVYWLCTLLCNSLQHVDWSPVELKKAVNEDLTWVNKLNHLVDLWITLLVSLWAHQRGCLTFENSLGWFVLGTWKRTHSRTHIVWSPSCEELS